MQAIRIGELARRAGVSVQTVRYYEGRGLMPEPDRARSGYRQYDRRAVSRLRFIRRAQELGFTLAEIGDLLALRLDPSTGAEDLRGRVREKMSGLDEKMHDLERIRSGLEHLLRECEAGDSSSDCPLLDVLEANASF
jgi:Hg(II)-responsive transcriptional regulator